VAGDGGLVGACQPTCRHSFLPSSQPHLGGCGHARAPLIALPLPACSPPALLPRQAATGGHGLGRTPALVGGGQRCTQLSPVRGEAAQRWAPCLAGTACFSRPLHAILLCPPCRYGERSSAPQQRIYVERKVHRERFAGEKRCGGRGRGDRERVFAAAGEPGWGGWPVHDAEGQCQGPVLIAEVVAKRGSPVVQLQGAGAH
jgi:hypothetical protein